MTYRKSPEARREPRIAWFCADYHLNITYLSQSMPAFAHRSPSPSVLPVLAALVSASVQTRSDSVKCHLPIEYSADLTPVVVGKGAGASWNAGGMENALDS